jgi:hypothetical protein
MLGNPGVTYDNLKATPNADVVIIASARHDRPVKEGLLSDSIQVALKNA